MADYVSPQQRRLILADVIREDQARVDGAYASIARARRLAEGAPEGARRDTSRRARCAPAAHTLPR